MENNNTIGVLAANAKLRSLRDVGLEQADWERANQMRSKNSNNFTTSGEPVGLFVDLDHFKQYGPGTYLFFMFAKRLAILFVILTLLSIPPIAFNIIGKGLDSVGVGPTKTALMQFSIANQPVQSVGMTLEEFQKKSEAYKSAVVIPDAVYSIVFFLFLLHWEWSSAHTIESLKKECDLPSYYTVKVKDLPPLSQARDLRDFMNQFGEVVEVSEVKDYDQCIKISKQLYQTQVKIQEERLEETPNNNKITRLNGNKIELFKALQQDLQRTKGKTQFLSERTNCLEKFSIQRRKKWCCSKDITPSMLYFDKLLRVQPCNVQPSSIIWQNMHLSTGSRVLRIILQTSLVLAVVFIAFVLILALNALVPQTSTYFINTSAYNYSQIVDLNEITMTRSWCLNKNSQEIYGNKDVQLKALCTQYFNRYYADIGISVAISLAVVIITIALVLLVKSLSRFQRYKSYNQQCSSTIFNLFLTNIFTTIIITMLLQAELFGFTFKEILARFIPTSYVKENLDNMRSYNDIKREWYVDIGYKICLNWLVLSLLPIAINPLFDFIYEKICECRAKKQRIQKKMEDLLNKPEFEFEEHYANMLTVVFVTFAFAGPMPILILVAAIALVVRYIYWKYYFIRFCRAPRAFDSSLNTKVMRLLPFALFTHLAISMYAYSRSDIFPFESSMSQETMELANRIVEKVPVFIGRIVKAIAISWLLGIVMTVLSSIWTLKLIFFSVFHRLYKKWVNADHRLPTELIRKNQSFDQASQKQFLNSYKIENNPDYSEILSIMKAVSSQKRLGTPPLHPIQQTRAYIEEVTMQVVPPPLKCRTSQIYPVYQRTPRISIQAPIQPLLPMQSSFVPEPKIIAQPITFY